jgi:hypothetical protein
MVMLTIVFALQFSVFVNDTQIAKVFKDYVQAEAGGLWDAQQNVGRTLRTNYVSEWGSQFNLKSTLARKSVPDHIKTR